LRSCAILEGDVEVCAGRQVHGPRQAGTLLGGERLDSCSGRLTGRDEGNVVRRSSAGPGELDGLALNDIVRGVDGQLSEDGRDERQKSNGGDEILHCR